MSGSSRKPATALTVRPGYEVGYGKPPESTRFRPGQSGNPKGRPKGSKNKRPGMHEERLKEIILDEAYRGITIREGDRNVTIPMAQAVMRSIAVNAAKGQSRAQRLFAELLAQTESARKILHDRLLETAIEYKVSWERELRRREALGITDLPDPLPHPDHVRVDFREGTVRFVGPMSKEEKAEWDEMLHWRQVLLDSIEGLEDALETEGDPEEIADIRRHLDIARETLARIEPLLSVSSHGQSERQLSATRGPLRTATETSKRKTRMT